MAAAALSLKRKLSFPVSRMWPRWVSRSRSAVVILASPNTVAHSLKLRFVVMITLVLVEMLAVIFELLLETGFLSFNADYIDQPLIVRPIPACPVLRLRRLR